MQKINEKGILKRLRVDGENNIVLDMSDKHEIDYEAIIQALSSSHETMTNQQMLLYIKEHISLIVDVLCCDKRSALG